MDEEKRLTDGEKQRRISQVETGLAFGGGRLSLDARDALIDIYDGKITHDEAVDRLLSKHKNRDGDV